ncbi:MAG: biotin/lipoyl-containing protein [Candidatus Methanomethylicaceae archaeon]
MRFSIVIRGVRKDIEVIPIDKDLLKVVVDGVEYDVLVEGSEALLPEGKKPLQTLVSELDAEIKTSMDQEILREGLATRPEPVQAVKPEIKREEPSEERVGVKPSGEGILDVKSPLPGVISTVEVKEGHRVKRGDVLLYIESMKMLNEIVAPKDGVVYKMLKGSGDTVNVGDLLVKIIVAGE